MHAIRHSRSIRTTAIDRRSSLAWLGLAAGVLAGTAAAVAWQTRQAERANPPEGRFIEVDGIRLHYIDRGMGQPLVLLHGNGDMARDFDIAGVLDLAADKYRVIAFDRPGYGWSDRPHGKSWSPEDQADLIVHALQRLGIDRPIVVGHSWGTLVALQLALRHRDAVQALVLMSGYYYPTVRLDVAWLSAPAIPLIGTLMRHTVSPLLSRLMWPAFMRRIFGPLPVPARFRRDFPVGMVLRPKQLQASATEAAMLIPAAARMRHRYGELTLPVVLLAGNRDRHVKTGVHTERLYRELPSARMLIATGAGHMVHYAAPEQVMEAIDSVADADGEVSAVRGAAALSSIGSVGV